jgi:general secretion pathway protein G
LKAEGKSRRQLHIPVGLHPNRDRNAPHPGKMKYRIRRGMEAYTLLELLIAMVLAGVITSIAMLTYNNYTYKGQIATAKSDIFTIAAAIDVYAAQHDAYPDSLADVGLSTKLDPWGNAYVYYNVDAYGKGHARKDRALNPINTDFDLYSMGKDGKTKSQITQKYSLDDIIRARNGAFIGLASDF